MYPLKKLKNINLCYKFFFSPFQFAAPIVHRQDGPFVPGVLSQMEQPPK